MRKVPMNKGIILASFMLVACGPSSCHLFGPSPEEVAKQKAAARAQADKDAIRACETRGTAEAQGNADQITQQQTIIKTTLDKVTEGNNDPQNPRALDWSIEIAALDATGWRWTETSSITSQQPAFLGTDTHQTGSTLTYNVLPADLQPTLTIVPHDDGTAALRFYCKTSGCVHLVGATRQDNSSTAPFSGTSSKAGTLSQSVNSNDWLLSTRTRAEGLKVAVEKLLSLYDAKPLVCRNPDGTPGPDAPLLPQAAASSAE